MTGATIIQMRRDWSVMGLRSFLGLLMGVWTGSGWDRDLSHCGVREICGAGIMVVGSILKLDEAGVWVSDPIGAGSCVAVDPGHGRRLRVAGDGVVAGGAEALFEGEWLAVGVAGPGRGWQG